MEQKKNIVQIGSFEGGDELSNIVKKLGNENVNKLILIEPNIKCNKKLSECYNGFDFTIENIVITNDEQVRMIPFYISDGHESISSIYKTHPLGHRGVESTEEYLLKSKTINNLLIDHGIQELDILYINASGYDEEIIQSIDLKKFNVKEIYYENCNIKNHDRLENFLKLNDFRIEKELFVFGWVNLAHKDTYTRQISPDIIGSDIPNNINDEEILIVKYQKPHGSTWSVCNIFDKFYNQFKEIKNTRYVEPVNTSEPAGLDSPHILTIKNSKTNKYIIVSYWDRAEELTMTHLGWEPNNMISLYTSAGVRDFTEKIKPLSYPCYSLEFDELCKTNKIDFKNKQNKELDFRGYLYGDRLSLSKIGEIKISSEKIFPVTEYYRSLSNNKIGLSLNGAGEICNRDMEILSAGSVLFRPKLKQKFHNGLIDGYHYISFDLDPDPVKLNKIIIDRFNEIKDNEEYLEFIANNGYKWFLENGSVQANVNLMMKFLVDEVEQLKDESMLNQSVPKITETPFSHNNASRPVTEITKTDLDYEEFKKRTVYLTTLSFGEYYTSKFTLKLIEDVLTLSDLKIYITTDVGHIIKEKYQNNDRVILNEIDLSTVKVRLWVNQVKVSDDFNFNLKYLTFKDICEDENSVIIFTDCDNSFDWWDRDKVMEYLYERYQHGFDFFGCRADWLFEDFLKEYYSQDKREHSLFWHKIYGYDLDKNPRPDWGKAPLVAEHLLVFVNNEGKMKRFYEEWKNLHDYLANKDYTEGTWAEGFEIGVAAVVAKFKPQNLDWSHHIFSKMIGYNGYKTGHKSEKNN